MIERRYRSANVIIALYTVLVLALLYRFGPSISIALSPSFLFGEAALLLLACALTLHVCDRVGRGFASDFTQRYISPKKNFGFSILIILFSSSLLVGILALFFHQAYSRFAILLFFADLAFVPPYSLLLILTADKKGYLTSLSEDIDAELKSHKEKKILHSLQKMKSIALDHLARKDYEIFGLCTGLLFHLTEKRKGKQLVFLYRCLKEMSSGCLNDSRACNLFLGALQSNFSSVFNRGHLPHTRILLEFASFIAVKTEEEFNIASSAASVSLIGNIYSSLISAKQSTSPKNIEILEYMGERALKKGYHTLLSETLGALGKIAVQCAESENMALLERTNNTLSRLASQSMSKGKRDLAIQVMNHFSRINNESYRNPKFFSIVWNITDCVGDIGMNAVRLHEESIIGTVASLLKKTGIRSIRGYIRGEKEDITPARYAIRKLKILKKELERENMNTAALQVEKAIWDIADAARF